MTGKANVLYLFDVDGTLTKPRQVMLPEMAAVLSALKKRVHVGIVSGSNIPKVIEQIAGTSGSLKDLADFDFVFAENGLDAYKRGEKVATQNIVDHCGEQLLQDLLNFGLRYMSDLKLPKKRGTFVEFRNGMINFSPIGRSCSQAERDEFAAFDLENGIRRKFVDALRQKFPDDVGLDFSIGGQISIDIYPQGWNKTYCLRFFEGENFEAIHFFGDRVTQGGNDYDIYVHPDTIGHAVKDPQDTAVQLLELLPELRDDLES